MPIAHPAPGGEEVDYLVEAAANPDILADRFAHPTPLGDPRTAGDEPLYTFRRADLAILDEDVWHLILDIEVLRELMLELRRARAAPPRDPARARSARSTRSTSTTSPARPPPPAPPRRRPSRSPRTPARTPSPPSATRTSTRAWLWPIRETMRKTSRTFSNVTALAEEYDEFVFACS